MKAKDKATLEAAASEVLRRYAAHHDVYGWMALHGIGESDYGRLIDAMGQGKGVFYHRLYGHHPVCDCPWNHMTKVPQFMEHVLVSDFFTQQGLPIIPGKFLEHPAIKEFCAGRTLEWNFVNAFDLLTGTLAIYAGYEHIRLYSDGMHSIDAFPELAKELGIGVLELAIAVTRHNPFLLFGAALHLAGTVRGLFGDAGLVYFRRVNSQYILVVATPAVDLRRAVDHYYLKNWSTEKALRARVNKYRM